MKVARYELTPMKDSRQSFYRKAFVEEHKNYDILMSYETPVCKIEGNKITLASNVDEGLLFSQTTVRHIKEFIYQETPEGLCLTINDLRKLPRESL